eukprot:gnl/TRDRNA2_/TRDRNA2_150251_c0_seq3.p1 gnl/TRDRNA2_/TRDRNA2_150251_c0~~gnl/TRDRNA2_/TRDRNA2_150251_c0_seq3.p1  ORF type:complete len:315 (+),score=71.50 gnl/TRDRNA2_/TRDRNA2_150251_c0_seq3:114-1058(+)
MCGTSADEKREAGEKGGPEARRNRATGHRPGDDGGTRLRMGAQGAQRVPRPERLACGNDRPPPTKMLSSKSKFFRSALVQMSTVAVANATLRGLNGRVLRAPKPLVWVKFMSHRDRSSPNLYVGGLPPNTKEDQLEAMFAQCGTVKLIKMAARRYGQEKHAYVHMSSSEEAEACMKKFDQTPALKDGTKLTVSFATLDDEEGSSAEDADDDDDYYFDEEAAEEKQQIAAEQRKNWLAKRKLRKYWKLQTEVTKIEDKSALQVVKRENAGKSRRELIREARIKRREEEKPLRNQWPKFIVANILERKRKKLEMAS